MGGDTALNKLFVGSIPYSTTDQELEDMFSKFGAIEEACVIYEKDTAQRRSRGFGFVTFVDKQSAKDAKQKMDQAAMGDRTINVDYAAARSGDDRKGGGDRKSRGGFFSGRYGSGSMNGGGMGGRSNSGRPSGYDCGGGGGNYGGGAGNYGGGAGGNYGGGNRYGGVGFGVNYGPTYGASYGGGVPSMGGYGGGMGGYGAAPVSYPAYSGFSSNRGGFRDSYNESGGYGGRRSGPY